MADPYVLGLLRHAKSAYPDGVIDHDRPLSPRGERDAAALGPIVAEHQGSIDLALVSSATRAQQTWALAKVAASSEREEPRIYEASTDTLIDIAAGVTSDVHSVLMVGHNPGFEALARALSGRGSDADALERLIQKFPTCALAVLASDVPFERWTSATVRLRSFAIARGG